MFLKEHLRVTISGPVQESKWDQKFHLNLIPTFIAQMFH